MPSTNSLVLRVLQRGGGLRAGVRLVGPRNALVVVKDFGNCRWPVRHLLGRWLLSREAAAYRRLQGIRGIPELMATLADGSLILEFVQPSDTIPNRLFFVALDGLLEEIRERGVLHLDVAGNVLCDDRNRPVLVDFGSALVLRWWMGPIGPFLRRTRANYDKRVVARLKKRLAPHLLTSEDRTLIMTSFPLEWLVRRGERLLKWGVRRADARLVARP